MSVSDDVEVDVAKSPKANLRYKLMLAFLIFGALIAAGLSLVFKNQKSLIYLSHVGRNKVIHPVDVGFPLANYSHVHIETCDGEKLHGYWFESASGKREGKKFQRPTLIYFHGTSGKIDHRLSLMKKLHDRFSMNILLVSYRGYGLSSGSPDAAGIRIDSQAVLEYAHSRPTTNPFRLIVFGESIGGAVTLDLVSKNQDRIHAVILQNTFLSLRKAIPDARPYLAPFAWFCSEDWDSDRRLEETVGKFKSGQAARMPNFLFLVGLQDELLSPKHSEGLYEIAKEAEGPDAKVILETFDNGKHDKLYNIPGFFDRLDSFFQACNTFQ